MATVEEDISLFMLGSENHDLRTPVQTSSHDMNFKNFSFQTWICFHTHTNTPQ